MLLIQNLQKGISSVSVHTSSFKALLLHHQKCRLHTLFQNKTIFFKLLFSFSCYRIIFLLPSPLTHVQGWKTCPPEHYKNIDSRLLDSTETVLMKTLLFVLLMHTQIHRFLMQPLILFQLLRDFMNLFYFYEVNCLGFSFLYKLTRLY